MQKDYKDLLFSQDVDAFNVVLQEPESAKETMYITPLHQCFTPEELQFEAEQGNLRDMNHLKRLSKKFLEDRVDIRRIADSEEGASGMESSRRSKVARGENDKVSGNYTFDITFEREQRAIIDDMEGRATSSRSDLNIMMQKENQRFDDQHSPNDYGDPAHHM